jgi:hypothetical protein
MRMIEDSLNAFLALPDWIVAGTVVAGLLLAIAGSCLGGMVL